jgi:CRISPR-associated exonuclease Cas4
MNGRQTLDEFSITASNLIEYLFCPRFTYFEIYLAIPQHEEKRFKVEQGRKVHDDKTRFDSDYLRKKIQCVGRKTNVYLASKNGLRGIVDEILFLADGTAAPLDYKYAEYKDKTFKNHKCQLAFYGTLIKECFNVPVNRGFIIYTRSRNRLIEVDISEKVYSDLHEAIHNLLAIAQRGIYPGPTRFSAQCVDCCYRNICETGI